MKTPLTTTGTLYTNKMSGSTADQSLLLGLTLLLPGALDVKGSTEHIQDLYFDMLGFSGFFRLMGQSHRERASTDYLTSKEIPETAFQDAVRITEDGNTSVDVLFCQMSFEDTPEEELRCTQAELDEAVSNNVFLSYQQFPLEEK